MKASDPESEFLAQISVAGVPLPAVEYRGIPGRRFRFDFAWPELMLAVEIEGKTIHGWDEGYAEGLDHAAEIAMEALE